MSVKIDYKVVEEEGEKPFVTVFETEYGDNGVVGEGATVATAMRNAARNLKKMSDELFKLADS